MPPKVRHLMGAFLCLKKTSTIIHLGCDLNKST
jgi:hypothetical protein